MSLRALVVSVVLGGLLIGCNSAKITDAYMSRDSQGLRRTTCFRPEWEEIHVVLELLSFKDDTFVTIVGQELYSDDEEDVVITLLDSELEEMGNLAPGKGEHLIAIPLGKEFVPEREAIRVPDEVQECLSADPECANLNCSPAPHPEPHFPRGKYVVGIWLDNRFVQSEKPDRSLVFEVSEECPCRPFPECPGVCYVAQDCDSDERCYEWECKRAPESELLCDECFQRCDFCGRPEGCDGL